MSFYVNTSVYCPNCPAQITRKGVRHVALACVEHNYSGCSVDIGECPQCGKLFEISYEVSGIKEIKVE